ncbi:SDR family NAD(P)-dependent oxidoreductase [Lapillicoccus jejuensis]|uniref:NAD(P)-dependent dehydrogenase (Short-subunit alcohol dehydrogenase family) n=1 Tax=Lapillicoccus jejuensis TaxID=402171 RepID=A0A542DZI8_9MICO|nr:SDR family oxidoreductase [Lapillicoccus jejuensis]TQJ08476.1 NAD(P)-dependent dehydrogenase (short-subunit alcohol dehydrogenase family) [Lapillicoccus jejuensis]
MPATPTPLARFTGRTALVTGAAHGIGRAIAHRLHSEGASVVLADLDGDAASEVAAALGERTVGVACDVTDRATVDAAVALAQSRFGGLDVVAGNVGVASGEDLDDLDDAAWARQLEPTLHGALITVQAAIHPLLRSPYGGAVVLTGSVNGLAAFGGLAYSAAKAGLGSLVQNLSVRYGASKVGEGERPVRFTVVAPGTVRTRVWDDREPDALAPLYPLGRIGEPEDIAAAVAFLASDDASWVTGIVLPVDGGVLAGPAQRFDDLGARRTLTPRQP